MRFVSVTYARPIQAVDFTPGIDHGIGMSRPNQERHNRFEPPRPVLLSSNSFQNVVNFRGGLVEALVTAGYPVRIAAPDVEPDWLQAVGAEAIEISVDRSGLNPLVDAALWLNYVRLMQRERPGCFLGYTAKPNIYGSLAAQMQGVPSIPNVSGLGTAFMSEGLLSRFVAMLYRLAFRRSPIVFFQNPDDRDLFVARKIVRADQARLLPGSGVDLRHFVPIETETANNSGELRFLFVGRLLGDKGVREFAEASRLLKRDQPAWRFQLLGSIDEGNRSGIRQDEVRQWIADGYIELLGHVDDVRPHIAAATAVVLPSYREGLSHSLLEAAAMARPLVATNVPGNRQIVEHGVNGLLCEVRDSQSLADAMRRLGMMRGEERAAMGSAGRALVERDYGEEHVIHAYLDALAQLTIKSGV